MDKTVNGNILSIMPKQIIPDLINISQFQKLFERMENKYCVFINAIVTNPIPQLNKQFQLFLTRSTN